MPNKKLEWKPVRIKLSQIKPWSDNPRYSTAQDAADLVRSESELGQMQTIAVGPFDKARMVDLYDGHQRCASWMAAWPPDKLVIALQSSRPLTTQERKKVAVMLHTATGRWDWAKLGTWDHADLADWGMNESEQRSWKRDAEELKAILRSEARPERDAPPNIEQAEKLIKKWKVETGSMWQIGEHRLLCGDATQHADVARLMQGELADLVFTDPPYGVEYTGQHQESAKEWHMLENDNLKTGALEEFLTAAFKNYFQFTHPSTPLYCFHASKTQREFENSLNAAGYEVKQQLIWNKGMSLGRSDYHWAHEPFFYCKKKDQRTKWYGDRTWKTIVGQPRTQLEKMSKEALVAIVQAIQNQSTTWEIDRDAFIDYVHSTQKPARLAAMAMINNTREGQVVADFFAGSGSTMVAAENFDRKCRSIEKDKGYCAVILERMQVAIPEIKIRKVE